MEFICILIGAIMGLSLSYNYYGRPKGELRIDYSDPDGPYLFLELNKSVSDILTQETIVLKVKQKNFLSRK